MPCSSHRKSPPPPEYYPVETYGPGSMANYLGVFDTCRRSYETLFVSEFLVLFFSSIFCVSVQVVEVEGYGPMVGMVALSPLGLNARLADIYEIF